jgi:hypothetical protein
MATAAKLRAAQALLASAVELGKRQDADLEIYSLRLPLKIPRPDFEERLRGMETHAERVL